MESTIRGIPLADEQLGALTLGGFLREVCSKHAAKEALVFHGPRLIRQMDRTVGALRRKVDQETDETLSRTMHFPVDWDPFFRETMTLEQVYRYGTQHYDFHRAQLTLEQGA